MATTSRSSLAPVVAELLKRFLRRLRKARYTPLAVLSPGPVLAAYVASSTLAALRCGDDSDEPHGLGHSLVDLAILAGLRDGARAAGMRALPPESRAAKPTSDAPREHACELSGE
jgi:hypothetical protein